MALQAEDAVQRAERINELLAGWSSLAAESTSRAVPALVDLLAENPYWTVKLGISAHRERLDRRIVNSGIAGS